MSTKKPRLTSTQLPASIADAFAAPSSPTVKTGGGVDVTVAGFGAGYESPSQFGHEDIHLFGEPPRPDIEVLKAEALPTKREELSRGKGLMRSGKMMVQFSQKFEIFAAGHDVHERDQRRVNDEKIR